MSKLRERLQNVTAGGRPGLPTFARAFGAIALAGGLSLGSTPAQAAPDDGTLIPARVGPHTVKTHSDLPPRVREALVDILGDEALDDASLSFMVWDVESDVELASSGKDKLINPASNAKLLTAAAALDILGPDYQWETEYYVTGPIRDGVLFGDLAIKGSGDPTVVSERLQGVAAAIRELGVRRITGGIIVDASAFDNVLEARGWEQEEARDRAYAAPVSGLSLNYNAVGLHMRPTNRDEPAVLAVEPPVEYVKIDGEITTGRWSRRLRVGTEPDRYHTVFEVGGKLGKRSRSRRIYRRVYDPPRYFGSAMVTFLRENGVYVRHRILPGRVPAGARLVHVDQSPRLVKVISDLNHYSNNFIAESVIKTIGAETAGTPATFDSGLAAVQSFVETKVGFEKGSYTFGNGSGLNDVNRVTAKQLITLLDYMHENFELGPEFESSLAVAGTQGTIRHRMREGPAERRLRAKTGTLTGVSALSGYVIDPRDRVLAFSILTEGFSGRVSPIWQVQNRIGEALASDGDAWEPKPREAPEVAEADIILPRTSSPAEPAKGGAP